MDMFEIQSPSNIPYSNKFKLFPQSCIRTLLHKHSKIETSELKTLQYDTFASKISRWSSFCAPKASEYIMFTFKVHHLSHQDLIHIIQLNLLLAVSLIHQKTFFSHAKG